MNGSLPIVKKLEFHARVKKWPTEAEFQWLKGQFTPKSMLSRTHLSNSIATSCAHGARIRRLRNDAFNRLRFGSLQGEGCGSSGSVLRIAVI